MNSHNKKSITELARELRKNQTPSERKLWEEIRYRKLDGKVHDYQKEYDKQRDFIITS